MLVRAVNLYLPGACSSGSHIKWVCSQVLDLDQHRALVSGHSSATDTKRTKWSFKAAGLSVQHFGVASERSHESDVVVIRSFLYSLLHNIAGHPEVPTWGKRFPNTT